MTGILETLVPYTGYLALILRVWVGSNFIIHARPKLQGLPQTIKSMEGLGVPASATIAGTTLELTGGIALIVGLFVPIVGLLFVVYMASISIMKKRRMHADYIAPGKPSYELDILYLVLSLVLAFLGAGVLSIDGALGF